MKLETYPDRDLLMMGLADRIAGNLNEALMLEDRVSFVVPGGSTPGPVFDALSAVDLDWSRVTVIPSDERWVPEAAPESNARLIKERLLVGRAAAAQFLPLYAEGEGPERLDELTQAVAACMPLNVALLGMGGDMHTASLFPGQAALRPEHRRDGAALLHFVKTPGLEPIVSRMTLSVPALRSAPHLHVVITGDDKRAALEEAIRLDDPFQAPIVTVLGGSTVHWAA